VKSTSEKVGSHPCLGTRVIKDSVAGDYHWETYKEVFAKINSFGSSLVIKGIEPRKCIGILSINRAEWVIQYLFF